MTTEDFTISMPESAPLGTFPGVITSVELQAQVATMYGTRDLLRWNVTVTTPKGDDFELDAITGVDPTPKAKLTKWLAAAGVVLKPGKSLGVRELTGKGVLVVVGENDDGFSTIVDIVQAPK